MINRVWKTERKLNLAEYSLIRFYLFFSFFALVSVAVCLVAEKTGEEKSKEWKGKERKGEIFEFVICLIWVLGYGMQNSIEVSRKKKLFACKFF